MPDIRVPMKLYDDIFDDVSLGLRIFFDDLKALKLYDSGMDNMIKFLFSKGYRLLSHPKDGEIFVHD